MMNSTQAIASATVQPPYAPGGFEATLARPMLKHELPEHGSSVGPES